MCPICGTLLELAESPQAQRERVFVKRADRRRQDQGRGQGRPGRSVRPRGAGAAGGLRLRPLRLPGAGRSPSSSPCWRWPSACCAGGARRSRPDRAAPRRAARRARTPSGSRPTSPATTSEAGSALDEKAGDRGGRLRRRRLAPTKPRSTSAAAIAASSSALAPGRGAVDDQQLIGARRPATAWRNRSEASKAVPSPAGRPATTQTSGSLAPAEPGPARTTGFKDRLRLGGPSQVLVQARGGGEAERLGEPRLDEVALEQRRAGSGRPRPRPPARRPPRLPARRLPGHQNRTRPGAAPPAARQTPRGRARRSVPARSSDADRAGISARTFTSARGRRCRAGRARRRSSVG